MTFQFSGELWYWKGPAPWFFVTVPEIESTELKAVLPSITYGWGMIPVNARIGDTAWYTAMFAKDGRYVLPVKASVRSAERIDEGDQVEVWFEVVKA